LIAEVRPDAIAVIPVIRNPGLVDYLKAGAEANVATAIWVQSWDNLTNKGLLHFQPDRVFLWNSAQVHELSRYHRISPDRAFVTGAQTFDHWFEEEYSAKDRRAFCAELGVDPESPIVLYLASSRQIAPNEPEFFARWREAVRRKPASVLSEATILVRPHPTLAQDWHERSFGDDPLVVMSPFTVKSEVNGTAFRARYRNELHHASVVVGINTSGFIDAAIFGKPACTVELPELFQGQGGTVHFRHLTRPGAELLRTASTLEEHVAMLERLVQRDPYAIDRQSARFVRNFVRPHGMDVRPTDVFVQGVLDLVNGPERPVRPYRVSSSFGKVLGSISFILGAPLEDRPAEAVIAHAEALARFGARKLRRDPRAGDVLVATKKRTPLKARAAGAARSMPRRINQGRYRVGSGRRPSRR
jgi:hypothetical protein